MDSASWGEGYAAAKGVHEEVTRTGEVSVSPLLAEAFGGRYGQRLLGESAERGPLFAFTAVPPERVAGEVEELTSVVHASGGTSGRSVGRRSCSGPW